MLDRLPISLLTTAKPERPRQSLWLPPFSPPQAQRRRDRLWELSPNLHCSIIGTCLTAGELKSILAKLDVPNARTLSEHDLHTESVSRAARKEDGGKLLHKALDRRHETEIKQFDRAQTAVEVGDLWRDASKHGHIAGAYWAALTHPATDRILVKEMFGEVHMLSHLVGRSVRQDLRRLSDLDDQVRDQAERIELLQARVRALTEQKVALSQEAFDLRGSARRQQSDPVPAPSHDDELSRLRERLSRSEAHAAAEANRRADMEQFVRNLAHDVRLGTEHEAALRCELESVEIALAASLSTRDEPVQRLDGTTMLYVGGRPKQVSQARIWVKDHGGRLLTHDGGIEEATTMIPGLVAQADAVFFPVDCISHDAAGAIKRACHDTQKVFYPLRSASLTALVAATAKLSGN